MSVAQKWLCLRVYMDEARHFNGKPLFEAIVLQAREKGLAGATVWRSPLGYGHSQLLHNANILRLSENLPMVVEIMDAEDKIRDFLPQIQQMAEDGIMTLQMVDVIKLHKTTV